MKKSKMLARGQPPQGEWHLYMLHFHEQMSSGGSAVIKGVPSNGCPTAVMLAGRGAVSGEERGDMGEVVTGGEGSSQAPLHRRAQLREPLPAKSHTPRAETHTEAWDEEDSKKDK